MSTSGDKSCVYTGLPFPNPPHEKGVVDDEKETHTMCTSSAAEKRSTLDELKKSHSETSDRASFIKPITLLELH